MANRVAVITHERWGSWARQLRPRLARLPVLVQESRSAADLKAALRAHPAALVVIDLGTGPVERLGELLQCREVVADTGALVLVLDPDTVPGAAGLARELGATLVRSGFVSPPQVVRLLERWTALAARRAQAGGWTTREPVFDLLGTR